MFGVKVYVEKKSETMKGRGQGGSKRRRRGCEELFFVLMVVSLTALSDPRTGQRWLPVLLAGFCAGFLLLRGRSYVDRWQAITLAGTAVLIVGAVVVRYALVLQSPLAVSISAAILVLVPVAGLTSAAVVPNTVYSPLFRKFVEWIEYLCLMPIFPLALWLMNVYAA
ncbi:type VII secretion integral membrane protein EccD, partial [Streptococcus pyogenes]|uniref:type VII secretion integral membrane protein EccD n=1 Tax=Streptococcus pyogenes TaxID=1314 RepID=UPI0034D2DE1F